MREDKDIRVMIVDDHRIVREGLKQVLGDLANGPPEMVVAGEALAGAGLHGRGGANLGGESGVVDVAEQFRVLLEPCLWHAHARGDIGASRLTPKAPTDVIGEVATTTGMSETRGGTGLDVTLEVEFPTLGSYTATGNGMYFDQTGDLAAQLITRDDTGAVIGMTVLSLKKDR